MSYYDSMTRQEALDRLLDFGIQGEQVYLIDIIPLIEMIWADGYKQAGEVAIFQDYLRHHVARLNRLAGCQIITLESAEAFLAGFLQQRPNPELLETLRSLIPSVRLSNSDETVNQTLRDSLLMTCLDIAASAVTHYPYSAVERFCFSEKRCWFEIMETLNPKPVESTLPTNQAWQPGFSY
jgi:hypothetical protein